MTLSSGNADIDRQLGGSPEEVAQLLESDDGDTRALALGELISRKQRAVPALLAALKGDKAQTRALAAEGLATIADPSTADALAAALKDKDGMVRARAASGLANMGDPRALDALVKTLGDAEDVLHAPYTLSTYALSRYGPGALPAVMPMLKAREAATRTRAHFIVRRILDPGGDPDLRRLLDSYDPNARAATRNKVVAKLLDWTEKKPPEAGDRAQEKAKDVDISGY